MAKQFVQTNKWGWHLVSHPSTISAPYQHERQSRSWLATMSSSWIVGHSGILAVLYIAKPLESEQKNCGCSMYTCMCSIPWRGNARHVLTAGHKQFKASVRGENIKSFFDRPPQSPKLLKPTPPSIGTSFVQIIKGAWIIMTLRQMKWQFIRPMTHRSHEPGYCCSKAIWICTRLDKVMLDASLGSKHNTHDVKVLN